MKIKNLLISKSFISNRGLLPLLFVLILIFFQSCKKNNELSLLSPNGLVSASIENNNNGLFYNLIYKGDTIVKTSTLGIVGDQFDLSTDVSILTTSKTSFDETWKTINGKQTEVRNQYVELVLSCKTNKSPQIDFDLIVRCYDEGMAFRFEIPKQENLKEFNISKENTEVNLKGTFTFWATNGERHNLGPIELAKYQSENAKIQSPIVFRNKKGLHLAIHESAIFNHAPFKITKKNVGNKLQISIPPRKEKGRSITSWRTFLIGENAGDLIESNLIVNLNEPSKIADPSWIKTGKTMWDWRVWGYKAADGFDYGLNTVSHKRFIDFAAENNIQNLLIDADWYGPEFSNEADPTSAKEGVNIEECMAYAKEKGVGVILYLNDIGAKKFGLERVIRQFSEWGAVGVKYGFMRGSDEERVKHTRNVVELCAKYKLTVNFHDSPIAPSGDRRTWPNLLTKEFCHSQADAKRSYFPETVVTSVFVNMLAGPLDMCNGWFDLDGSFGPRVKVFEVIPGTVAAEVAKLIVVYSGTHVLPDSPEEYLKKEDLFECIKEMPAQFESYKVLQGEIGEYISVARKSGNNWFIGSLTNRDARELEMDFSFLEKGEKYQATLYEDTGKTHFLDNKESYQVRKVEVDSTSEIKVNLAPGGGHSIWLKQI